MQPDLIYVPGEDIAVLWAAWNDALAARCDHELACLVGCDTRDRHCQVGRRLAEAEQLAHARYAVLVAGRAAA